MLHKYEAGGETAAGQGLQVDVDVSNRGIRASLRVLPATEESDKPPEGSVWGAFQEKQGAGRLQQSER